MPARVDSHEARRATQAPGGCLIYGRDHRRNLLLPGGGPRSTFFEETRHKQVLFFHLLYIQSYAFPWRRNRDPAVATDSECAFPFSLVFASASTTLPSPFRPVCAGQAIGRDFFFFSSASPSSTTLRTGGTGGGAAPIFLLFFCPIWVTGQPGAKPAAGGDAFSFRSFASKIPLRCGFFLFWRGCIRTRCARRGNSLEKRGSPGHTPSVLHRQPRWRSRGR